MDKGFTLSWSLFTLVCTKLHKGNTKSVGTVVLLPLNQNPMSFRWILNFIPLKLHRKFTVCERQTGDLLQISNSLPNISNFLHCTEEPGKSRKEKVYWTAGTRP